MTNLVSLSALAAAAATSGTDLINVTQGSTGPNTGIGRKATLAQVFATPPAIGGTTPAAGAFTTVALSADPTTALQAATKQYTDTKLPLAGGTLTGALVLAADPASALQPATKQYSDLNLPKAGGTMTGPIVLSADPAAPLQPATKQYADALGGGTNFGRNLAMNGQFNIAQRGLGPWTVGGYTLDRWQMGRGTAGGTGSVLLQAVGDLSRTQIGDEAAKYQLGYTFTGGAGAGDADILQQPMENVRNTAGRTITVSFWAIANSGTPKVGINWSQQFGTGGAPSALVWGTAQAATLGTTWARYTATFNIPSVAGKTFGTNADTDMFTLYLTLSSGATNNVLLGGTGVQSSTVTFWGVQLEFGSVATALEKRPIGLELALCQRYFVTGIIYGGSYLTAGGGFWASASLPVTMRVTPTVALGANASTNVSGLASAALGAGVVYASGTATATASTIINTAFTASADL